MIGNEFFENIRNEDLQSNWWIVLYLLTFVFCSFTRVGAIKEFTIEKLNSYHSKDELKWKTISFKDIIEKVAFKRIYVYNEMFFIPKLPETTGRR